MKRKDNPDELYNLSMGVFIGLMFSAIITLIDPNPFQALLFEGIVFGLFIIALVYLTTREELREAEK